ncbi:MAG: glycosyltransferase [Bacteroidales bacterium]|nr:glycosyltransferase [Bacteroidales bacterium]
MSFANEYLAKQPLFSRPISQAPLPGLEYIIVIPCYNENKLLNTLDSLYRAERPSSPVEIIVVINSSETSPQHILHSNKNTLESLNLWLIQQNDQNFRVFSLEVTGLSKKHAGAGLARKIGMDEAVRRFNKINNPNGIILSMDADTTCSSDYFTAIEKELKNNPECTGFNLYFEHPLNGTEFKPEIYDAITVYELYLRYYIESLRLAGFPYAYHTVGSCFGVKAAIYSKQGGMNRRQAGEDFYFLHKIFPLGKWIEVNSTTVFPSSRLSDRIPFGTGPAIKKIIEDKGKFESFHPGLFDDLNIFIQTVKQFYQTDEETIQPVFENMPDSIRSYLNTQNFFSVIFEINENTGSLPAFLKRFYGWFNGFNVLKFLNYGSIHFYKRMDIQKAAIKLLTQLDIKINCTDNYFLLQNFRHLQRNIHYINPLQQ